MLRPFAAGLMCLGLVTLAATATRGQEAEDAAAVNETTPPAALAPSDAGKLVEIEIGDDTGGAAGGEAGDRIFEAVADGDVIIRTRDGRVIEKVHRNSPRLSPTPHGAPSGLIDPGTRAIVEKVMAGLKDEAKRLGAEGKKEEYDDKVHSIRALERLLNAGPRVLGLVAARSVEGPAHLTRMTQAGPAAEQMKKIQERIEELRAQSAQEPQGDSQAKLHQEMAALQDKLAQAHAQMAAQSPGRGAGPGTPGMPGRGQQGMGGMPGMPGMGMPGMGMPGMGMPGMGMMRGMPQAPQGGGFSGRFGGRMHGQTPGNGNGAWGGGPPEAEALMHKAEALAQAAARLREAGIDDQARDLNRHAEKLKAEADKLRAQSHSRDGAVGAGGLGTPEGPLPGLVQTIHELHEQIQQLRKEVGELRELLQRRQ